MDAGLPAGPDVGRTLHALLNAVMEGRVPNDRGPLLEEARRLRRIP